MEILRGLSKLTKTYPRPVVAIGIFDGLHQGHQKLIRKTLQRAQATGGTPMVLTFYPHPVNVLRPDIRVPLIVSLDHRLELIKRFGIRVCIVVRFTKSFSNISPQKFVEQYLVRKLGVCEVIVGDDFRFGRDRSGTIAIFEDAGKQYGFKVHAIAAHKKDKRPVSSTRIRVLISQGKFPEARKMLGRPVSVMGRVVPGDKRGQSLGYPTANILVDVKEIAVPPTGVYAVRILIGGRVFDGVANIGVRPSFTSSSEEVIEVHLFDFDENLYGKEIIVQFFKRLRDEKKFSSKEGLIAQIRKDAHRARTILSRVK